MAGLVAAIASAQSFKTTKPAALAPPTTIPTFSTSDLSRTGIFYAGGVSFAGGAHATQSYLARWDSPGAATGPAYRILHTIDRLDGGPLGGHFVQIAPVVHGEMLYLFGTGAYRASGVYLARKPLAA